MSEPSIKRVGPRAADEAPTDPDKQPEPWLATVLRLGVYALTAFVLTWTVAVWEGVAGATLGASLASLAGRFVSRSRVRTTVVVGASAVTLALGLFFGNVLVGSAAFASVMGPSNALRAGDLVSFGVGAFAIALALRTLSARRRSYAVLEAIAIALAFAQLVVAHRHGAIHRPYGLADPILERGGDPTWALIAIGGIAAVVLGLLFFSERSVMRSALHLGAAFLLLLITLVATQLVGMPEPSIDDSIVGSRSEGGDGEGGGGRSDGPEFRDDYDDEHRNEPVAIVVLHDEYSPPSGAYYFREDAFSQYNGRRMVAATMSGVDDDVASGFPAVSPIEVTNAPPVGAFRGVVETTVGLIAEHPRPIGLESPIRFMPTSNPSSTRFARTYRVRSAVLTSDLWGLLSIGDRRMIGIEVTPLEGSSPAGTTVRFRANGTFDDGSSRDVTDQVTWGSSDPAVATPALDASPGAMTAVGPGTAEVFATIAGQTGRASITVTSARLEQIVVGATEVALPVGFTRVLTATGRYGADLEVDVTDRVRWDVDGSAVTTSERPGAITGADVGHATVTASLGGVSGSVSIDVRDVALTALEIAPRTMSLAPGDVSRFEVTGTFADGTTIDVTSAVTWGTEPANLVSADAATAGRVIGGNEGTFPVTASVGAVSAPATLTVIPMMELGVGDPSWPPDVVAHYTRGPADARYAELAHRMLEDLPTDLRDDPFAQALAITNYLGVNGIYSLRSRHAGAADPTADFLFGDMTGYCVHFAHAAVYLMRSIGLPARVATGYMLPEEARRGGSAMLITGQWSHAWPEVYVTGVGWVVVDVAPERSLDGAPAVPDESLQALLAELLRGETPLPFDGSDAPTSFADLWDAMKGPLARGLLGALIFVLLFGYAGKGWRQLAPRFSPEPARPRLVYRATLDRLASAGVRREVGESPESFAARVKATMPDLMPLTDAHVAKSFGGTSSVAPGELFDRARSVRRGLRDTVPLWRRALGALNPYSWLLTR